ncbi:hypothetical protein [Pseudomonas sp. PDM13]|uniref:hypothetical protein n=1 Tax=Pseudomonas sp. PDM13 TaxID=2769255 RepID=UPI0021DF7D12|nr:hypothetical protein [Pseudomonas sp. PDM13]MCU9948260.1 hypothetical protein [Pseudomonas sp. PDM13]MCU9948275.1 hypothetical protein [Pseudomonas sp. PDM13]MDN4145696.1 hypothetical protein [Pseudomonas tohonis]
MKLFNRISRNQLAVAVALVVASPLSMAAAGDLDFATMIAAVSGAAVIAAFMSMGVVKLGPNFAKWAINKVAGFFGR